MCDSNQSERRDEGKADVNSKDKKAIIYLISLAQCVNWTEVTI